MTEYKPIQFVLLKVASKCNINCTYCYWFKDETVYQNASIIKDEVLTDFYEKLKGHIAKNSLRNFSISLHGGEPLLAGKSKIENLLFSLREIEMELNFDLKIYLQTNAILIDDQWCEIFKKYNVDLGISLDGPKHINDLNRVDFKNQSTHCEIIENIGLLKSHSIKFGVLAVFNPDTDPEEICDYFIDELQISNFDILIPDANYTYESIPRIQEFYIKLFRLWYERYFYKGVTIRIAKTILQGLLGRKSRMQALGHNTVDLSMIKTDGQIEVLDFMHVLGTGFTKNLLNIRTNEISDIQNDEFWQEVYDSSLNLNEKCLSCKYGFACGGGHIASRWSDQDRLNNPSVYCEQLFEIFESSLELVKKTVSYASSI